MGWRAPDAPPFKSDAAARLRQLALSLGGWTYNPDDPAVGPAGAWVPRAGVGTFTAAGAARPTKSATSMNGRSGITGNGAANIMSAPLDFSAFTAMRVIAAMKDTVGALAIPLELTANAALNDGGLAAIVNDTYAFEAGARGTVGIGLAGSNAPTLATPVVMSFAPDTTLLFGLRFLRMNSVARQVLAPAAGCVAGPLANSSLFLFGRSGASLLWAGTFGNITFLPGNADDDDLQLAENLTAALTGLPQTAPQTSVFFGGDSIVVGLMGGTGGYIPQVVTVCGLAGKVIRSRGPYFSQVYHRGVAGETAASVAAAPAALAAELLTFDPAIVCVCWGVNDLGTGLGVAPTLAAVTSIVNNVKATLPNARIIVQSPVVPTGGPYFANVADFHTYAAALPAVVAGLGATLVLPGLPVQSDGIHPIDGPTGYGVLATNMSAGLLTLL